ncbi:MAG: TIGR03085 family protein [Streptosporangiales bacterium]|nr:TIGR03085 family protein [Streptosporangiales bacterium]
MTSLARTERAALCDLLDELGPDAPTLCEGWTTSELAAHLVLRERRPDAVAGLLVRSLAARADRIQRGYTGLPWPRLVDLVRSGPPRWSPAALPPVDAAVNTIEFYVHHEDVRRAGGDWSARTLTAANEEELWRRLRMMARPLLRKAPTGVVLRRDDGVLWRARPGSSYVTLSGPASELVLYAYGRGDQATVEVLGDPADTDRFRKASLGF